jgi:GDP/UDP-N,N'-diacetylbacillosamine 2-epimerase (hydrolysing)
MGIKKNVYYVGGLGAYNVSKIKIIKSKKKLSQVIKFNFLKKNFLITFNPVTLEKDAGFNCLNNLIFVLKKYNQFGLIFTISNIDFNFNKFNSKIYNFCKNLTNAKVFKQLGKKNYFSTMSNVDLVIGNSSSGLLEAPSFNIPTINIGSRQDGRIKAKTVIDADCSKKGIEKAIQIGLTKKYNKISKKTYNPYYKNNTVENIILILKKTYFN